MNDIHITSAAPDESGADRAWMDDWTIFYWGWWIAWAPFVGMFIAKISRGRTVRQIITGSMFGAWQLVLCTCRCACSVTGSGGIVYSQMGWCCLRLGLVPHIRGPWAQWALLWGDRKVLR